MNKLLNQKTLAFVAAFVALFSWGIHGPAGRFLANEGVNMYYVAVTRFWIGTFVFFLFLLYKKDFGFSIMRKHISEIIKISVIGICFNSILYHVTLGYLHGTLVMILENLAPLFVMLIVYFKDHIKPAKNQVIALIVALVGLLVIILGKSSFPELSETFTIGVILGILTGITFGAYIYLSANFMAGKDKSALTVIKKLFWIFLFSSIIMSPVYLFTHTGLPSTKEEHFWLWEMGIFQSGLSYLLWNYALTYISANTASILFSFTVLFTTINEVLFLHLPLTKTIVIGGVLITLSGYILSKKQKLS